MIYAQELGGRMINTKCSMCASGSSISILIPSVFLGPSFLLSRLLTLSLRSPSSKGAGARLCVACAARLRLPLSPAPCPYLPRERACLRLQLRAGRASGEAAERGHRERRWRVAGSTPRAWHETNHHKKTRACAHAGTHTHTHTVPSCKSGRGIEPRRPEWSAQRFCAVDRTSVWAVGVVGPTQRQKIA